VWGGKVRLFALADKPEIARLAKSLMERLLKGKFALAGETQGEGDVNVVECSHMRSQTDLKSELAEASQKSGKTDNIFSSLRMKMS
jgi:hypothetical protein